jgi:hypothetical protein
MSRHRVLRVLFVRPDDGQRVSSLYAFPESPDPAELLPVALLRLATAVKLGSGHRVFVHDARREKVGNRSVRAAAGVNRADVAVIELELGLLPDGLEAARAAREGGCGLVLATGPAVRRWPEAVAGMPEFDGLLHPGGAPALLALLARRAVDALSASALAEALEMPPAPPPQPARGTDRRLLDYAAYRACHPARPLRVGGRVDKGRWAGTPMLLDDEAGALRSVADVRAELDECALLGVHRIALRPGEARPSLDWLAEALSVLPERRVILPAPSGSPRDLTNLPSQGAVALDLGDLPVGDAAALELAEGWRDRAASAGLEVLGRACFGQGDLAAEERGLAAIVAWRLPLGVALVCPVPPADPAASLAWRAWLDAPGPGFVPPVRGGHRVLELAERARVLLAPAEERGVRAAAGRIVRWARGAAV